MQEVSGSIPLTSTNYLKYRHLKYGSTVADVEVQAAKAVEVCFNP
jgi:hypothetical protein